MKKPIPNTPNWTALRGGRKLIDSAAFTTHLRERGHAPGTIREYRRRVAVVAYWLSEHNLRLASLRGTKVSSLLQRYLPRGAADGNFRMHRAAINSWLKFKGCFAGRRPAYQGWLSDFLDFLSTHRGLAASTRENYRYRLIDYLAWQCGGTRPDWSKIQVEDIWRYAEHCTSVNQPFTVAGKLMVVRQFLRFVQLRGAGSPVLACAVPRVANFRRSQIRSILSGAQRRRLLQSFDRRRPSGLRDYALTLLMVDLGLRVGEVVRLRLGDVDWHGRLLTVPIIKTHRGRTLPLPRHIATAMRAYLRQARPKTEETHFFLRHHVFLGRPLTVGAARFNLIEAYRRCGFPRSWTGTHILRRTFATRLHAKGASMRQVADLLGHQQVTTTAVYTQVAVQAMRFLAQTWPR